MDDPTLLQILAKSVIQLVGKDLVEETKYPSVLVLSETIGMHISFLDS